MLEWELFADERWMFQMSAAPTTWLFSVMTSGLSA